MTFVLHNNHVIPIVAMREKEAIYKLRALQTVPRHTRFGSCGENVPQLDRDMELTLSRHFEGSGASIMVLKEAVAARAITFFLIGKSQITPVEGSVYRVCKGPSGPAVWLPLNPFTQSAKSVETLEVMFVFFP